ncbi:uncharacterized protein LOC106166397 isoform X2 [Lingula anatina]|uniref:Uncharacterized protein LOC106166397 isoform X2 n=1 Tax=Lingula anatina TaxID=7574 RepID=A0A1S3IS88_LINAN|nr:uncharacterized protein LOC106166397 isoform X2 [Lingula anatina]|eukprot:XP_013400399.1 uncharacterized protein LOC106166397 isoform X2 [Lingula anatina]
MISTRERRNHSKKIEQKSYARDRYRLTHDVSPDESIDLGLDRDIIDLDDYYEENGISASTTEIKSRKPPTLNTKPVNSTFNLDRHGDGVNSVQDSFNIMGLSHKAEFNNNLEKEKTKWIYNYEDEYSKKKTSTSRQRQDTSDVISNGTGYENFPKNEYVRTAKNGQDAARADRKPRRLPQIPPSLSGEDEFQAVSNGTVPESQSERHDLHLPQHKASPMSISTSSEKSLAEEIWDAEHPQPSDRTPLQTPETFSPNLPFSDEGEEEYEENPHFFQRDRALTDDMHLKFNTTSANNKAFLSFDNVYLMEDSSPEEKPRKKPASPTQRLGKIPGVESKGAISRSSSCLSDLCIESTHRGAHKFIPRHSDEIAVEIGDPIYVEEEADDLWCHAVNLRTGKRGIFPSAYVYEKNLFHDEETEEDKNRVDKFMLYFLGSIEVNFHKGHDVLCQAIHKVALTRRMTLNTTPPPQCRLEISSFGIKMIVKTKSKDKDKSGNAHFFSLKNVSFCGFHPKNQKYFGFITKHPTEGRFACHVYIGETSTKPVAEAVGDAFKRFYQEYMAYSHPTEDIYLE